MKKSLVGLAMAVAMSVAGATTIGLNAYAVDTILSGVYADNIPLGGDTREEAVNAINLCVSELGQRSITLYTVNDEEVAITPSELGFYWSNPEIVDEALKLGHTGNVVSRYKAQKDLNYTNKIYKIEYKVDENQVRSVLEDKCATFDVSEADGLLTRENGQFIIHEGQTGSTLDVEASVASVSDFFENVWTGENSAFQLVVKTSETEGSYEQLSLVKDVLGSFHTSFKSSSADRCANVANGASLINGSLIFPGEEFSFYNHVKPFTLENGYKVGAAYAGGKVVDSIGGGICQVSSTLYNSVLLSELEVVERKNHAMIVNYVDPARDATIAEASGIDFRFKNNTDAPIYIEAYTENKELFITIFGHETRPSDRTVEYKSEILSTTVPEGGNVYTDSSLPVGSISTTGAHTGYEAKLWKIVTENGETTKELVNTSSYKPVAKYITVGTATDNSTVASIMSEAVATNDIDTVRGAVDRCKAILNGTASPEDDVAAALAQYEAALAAQQSSQQEESPSEEAPSEEVTE